MDAPPVNRLARLRRNQRGQGLIEYGLIFIVIAMLVFAMLATLGRQTAAALCQVSAGLNANSGGPANGIVEHGWGNNPNDELDGTGNSYSSPIVVQPQWAPGGCYAKMMSAGNNQTLALVANGTVWTWGNGSATPIELPGLGGSGYLTNVVSIAQAGVTSYALRGDGTVWAWGSDSWGDLGQGSCCTNSTTPVQVTGLTGVQITAIAASGSGTVGGGNPHPLALDSQGNVWVWGYNGNGDLGAGATDVLNHPTPSKLSGLTNVASIAAGAKTDYAADSLGNAWAWGYSFYGEAGASCVSPCAPVTVPGIANVSTLAGGEYYVIALKRDGTVWNWGYNTDNGLGQGAVTCCSSAPLQVPLPAAAIAVSAYHAVLNGGTVYGWGPNGVGQVGNGTVGGSTCTCVPSPVQVTGLSQQYGISTIAGAGPGYYSVSWGWS